MVAVRKLEWKEFEGGWHEACFVSVVLFLGERHIKFALLDATGWLQTRMLSLESGFHYCYILRPTSQLGQGYQENCLMEGICLLLTYNVNNLSARIKAHENFYALNNLQDSILRYD